MTKASGKVRFSPQRLEDARKASGKKWSYRSLAKVAGVNERTIRKCRDAGLINPELLDKIAKILNVDFAYLKGEFDSFYDQIEDEKTQEKYKKIFLAPSRHPYSHHLPEEVNYDKLIVEILKLYGISPDSYSDMKSGARLALREKLHSSIYQALHSYFPHCSPFGYFYASGMPKPTLDDILAVLADSEEETDY